MAELAVASPTRRPSTRWLRPVLWSLLLIAVIVLVPALVESRATTQDVLTGVQPPSSSHWLGTDDLGRDILARVLYGIRSAVVGPVVLALVSVLAGSALGLLAAYRGGRTDLLIARFTDVVLSLPAILLAIVVGATLDAGYWGAVAILAALSIPYDTRLVRGAAREQVSKSYVDAARMAGLSPRRIMWWHVWPNLWPLLIATFFLNVAVGVVSLASLAFLGVGGEPGDASWGLMVSENYGLVYDNVWAVAGPALAIVGLALAWNFAGVKLEQKVASMGGPS